MSDTKKLFVIFRDNSFNVKSTDDKSIPDAESNS